MTSTMYMFFLFNKFLHRFHLNYSGGSEMKPPEERTLAYNFLNSKPIQGDGFWSAS